VQNQNVVVPLPNLATTDLVNNRHGEKSQTAHNLVDPNKSFLDSQRADHQQFLETICSSTLGHREGKYMVNPSPLFLGTRKHHHLSLCTFLIPLKQTSKDYIRRDGFTIQFPSPNRKLTNVMNFMSNDMMEYLFFHEVTINP